MKPTELVSKLLANATNLDVVNELVAEDATYVSLNYHDPDLTAVSRTKIKIEVAARTALIASQIEPWCGTHKNAGPAAVHKTFVDVGTFWEVLDFQIYAIFSGPNFVTTTSPAPDGEKPGTDVGVFGRFKYRSRTIERITDSPFCVWAKVDEDKQKVTYMQFMEDTLDTAKSFRKSGRMVYASNPEGGEVVIGDNE